MAGKETSAQKLDGVNFMKNIPLPIAFAVFVSGFSVMGVEILSSRLVAPILGTSVLVWTNLIGVILLALAAGAWLGGYVADKNPNRAILGIFLFTAGIFASFLTFTAQFGLWLIAFLPETYALPILALTLLAPPALILGAISPAAVRLTLREVGEAGNVAGKLSALGTIGSLLGTYVTGYILLSRFSTTWILTFLTILLYSSGLLILKPRKKPALMMGVALSSLIYGSQTIPHQLPGIILPSAYSNMRVNTENFLGRPMVTLWMDNTAHGGTSPEKTSASLFPYYDVYERLSDLLNPNATSMLSIGGGTFHGSRGWLEKHPTGKALAIERDPSAILASQTYFGLKDDPRLTILEGDGRAALHGRTERFDTVLIDAFADEMTIPWHLITREAWQEYASHLNDDAFVAMNLILHENQNHPGNQELIAGIANAAKPFFKWQKIVHIDAKNTKSGLTNTLFIQGNGREPTEEEIQTLLKAGNNFAEPATYPIDLKAFPAFTDAYAPVEFLTIKMRG